MAQALDYTTLEAGPAHYLARLHEGVKGKRIAYSADAHYTHSRMCQVIGVESVAIPSDAAGRMEVVGAPDKIEPVQSEVQAKINAAEGRVREMISIERFDFYDRAREAYAVIQTGERRFYGCFIFRKGVIAPEE